MDLINSQAMSRREALAALGLMAGATLIEGCGGSSSVAPGGGGGPPAGRLTSYPVTGDFTTPTFLTEAASGRSVPYQLFIPAGATPATPLPLVIFIMGAGQRSGNNGTPMDPTLVLASGTFGFNIKANKASVPCFVMLHCQTGGPDPAGLRYSRNSFFNSYTDVITKYNIDMTRMHLAGYSAGAIQAYTIAYRWPKIFASLSLFDGVPGYLALTNEGEVGGDLMNPATVTTDAQARAQWAAAVGDIPLNYQHGALDLGTSSVNDLTVRINDPTTSWFPTFAANGLTVPTTVAATTSPSPTYSTALKHVYVPYSQYDHGGLNTGGAYNYNTPWWNWVMARVRTDYAP